MTSKKTFFRKAGLLLLAAFIGFNAWILVTGKTFFYKTLYYNFADIDDYLIFDNDTLHKSPQPKAWPQSPLYNKVQLPANTAALLDSLETIALVVIKNDSLVYEQYWDQYGAASHSNSFSMAKSWVSALFGVCLQKGYIKSLDQPVADFIPSFKEEGREKITIRNMLMMASGLNWNESYANPLTMTSEAYYGSNLPAVIDRLRPEKAAGKEFRYKSGDTQILGLILEKASGMSLADFIEKELWQPLGAEQDAYWSLDKEKGHAKAYCCLNSNAKDFARIGKLYLDSGRIDGKQVIPYIYIKESLSPVNLPNGDGNGEQVDFYGYQWWLIQDQGRDIYYARGILGQYMIVIPSERTIIVRLGKKRGPKQGNHYKEVWSLIDYGRLISKK